MLLTAFVQKKKDKVQAVLGFGELNEFVECSGADADTCDKKLRSYPDSIQTLN